MLLLILIDVVGIKNFKNPIRYFKDVSKIRFFEFIKDNENKKPLKELIRLERPKKLTDDRIFIFYATLFLIVAAFVGRYYFYIYDIYLLSDLWVTELNKVILFDENIWFNGTVSVEGELAMSNLFSKLVDVSPEVGLQSLAILEAILLSLIIFWAMRKIAFSKILAPMIAFLAFVFLYTFSPIEIHYLLQNEPVLMGLTLAIPTMIYTLRPDIIKFKKVNYFVSFVICFFAIGLIDLFTLLILLPPFYILALLVVNKNYLSFKLIAIAAYVVGTSAVLLTYYFMCTYYQNDFLIFLQSSLISVTSFTYMPNLIIPFDELLTYYQYGSLFSILILPFLIWHKKEAWKPSLVFMLYFNLLVTLSFLKIEWIDSDLLRLALSVFIPICYGITVAIILRLLYPLYKKLHQFRLAITLTITSIVFAGIVYTQIEPLSNIKASDKTPRMVLDAYDKILHEYFPHSYAVVNDNVTQTLSLNKHFFVNYEDFLFNYLESDSIYHHNRKKPKFFIENPQYVIPKSILVFVYHDNTETENYFAEQDQLEPLLKEHIHTLEKRGRKVSLFYESPYVNVYEIVNEPKSSKIDDLIY
ncbi:hypothetical protein EQG68_07180 [Flavobacterium piscinae]|uniref:Glycosyltransferase RgtA/B/C/D-like domain-containing protein n=1 Tax=Flavobacterium piscinae TaxID=2506424 RepID=A0A4Q1KRN7_9FLAO|nr:hypothetical protein [Flavobacterium piscinae]RXR32602.1 hypothetical protein EQG68_07180 [Flavobacterium piscinae]